MMLEGLFRCTKWVSDTLQSPELDYASATGLVQDLLEEFAEKRSQDSLQMVWEEAERVCEDMSMPGLFSARDRKVPNKFRDFVVDITTGLGEPVSSQVDYCNRVYFPLIDRMTNELKKRFSESVSNVLEGVCALDPKSGDFLKIDRILPLSRNYG